MLTVNSCCFCCSLAQGTIASAVISLFSSFINLSLGAWLVWLSEAETDPNNKSLEETKIMALMSGIGYIVSGLLMIIVSILLLYGANKKKKSYFTPWLGVVLFSMVINAMRLVMALIIENMNDLEMLIEFISLVIVTYLFIVVYSYYQTINSCELMVVGDFTVRYEPSEQSVYSSVPTTTTTTMQRLKDEI